MVLQLTALERPTVKIAVYHPQYPNQDGALVTHFIGERVACDVEDGRLLVSEWETGTETGTTVFASGQWAYVEIATRKDLEPAS